MKWAIYLPSWTLLESGIKYKVEGGRENDIIVTETDPPLPPHPPTLAKRTEWRVMIKWNAQCAPGSVIPDFFQLNLYRLKDQHYADPDSVPLPTLGGYEILRSDIVGHPTKEESMIWEQHILPYWMPTRGSVLNQDYDPPNPFPLQSADNWPGNQCAHKVTYRSGTFPTLIPLIVAIHLPYPGTTKLLVLFEIKRKQRLRLFVRQIKLEVKEKFDCFIATAAYGSPLAPQVAFLRHVRDQGLRRSRIGSVFIDAFESIYYKFSPYVAEAMHRNPRFKRRMRWLVVAPIVKLLTDIFLR